MTCRETLSLLEAYIDRDLSAAQAADLTAHLDQCEVCRLEYQKSTKLRELLSALPSPDPGESYFEETNRLILAKTIDGHSEHLERIPVTEETAWYRRSLARSVVAFGVSACLMVTALMLGSSPKEQIVRVNDGNLSMFAVSSLTGVTGPDERPILTQDEQMALTVGVITVGAPGSLGRFGAVEELIAGR